MDNFTYKYWQSENEAKLYNAGIMTEQSALAASTGWVSGKDRLYGFLPFKEANFLVGTGKYVFHSVSPWGYVIREVDPAENKAKMIFR